MANDAMIVSESGVKLLDLGWGYQIVYDNIVMSAIQDSQQGPRRTLECTQEAQASYRKYDDLFTRAKQNISPAGERSLYILAQICNQSAHPAGWKDRRVNGNTINALHRRNLIRRRPYNAYRLNYMSEFEPVLGRGDDGKLS